MENWKAIKYIDPKLGLIDFSGIYEVSDKGNIRSLDRMVITNAGKSYQAKGRIMKQKLNKASGYNTIVLAKNGVSKEYRVHRIVALVFIPNNNPDKIEVNHIDENKLNNSVDNLEWVSKKENINHGTRNERASLWCSKRVICENTGKIYRSINEAEKELDIYGISNCCKGIFKYLTVNGERCTFKFLDENDNIIEPTFPEESRKIICTTTNEVFNSRKEAAYKYNVAVVAISSCLNGRYSFGGRLNGEKLVWKYLEDSEVSE